MIEGKEIIYYQQKLRIMVEAILALKVQMVQANNQITKLEKMVQEARLKGLEK